MADEVRRAIFARSDSVSTFARTIVLADKDLVGCGIVGEATSARAQGQPGMVSRFSSPLQLLGGRGSEHGRSLNQ